MTLIDTHAHLNDPKFQSDIDEVVARANAAGVDRIVVCGYDAQSSHAAVELAGRYECVFAAVGIHPHDAKHYDSDSEAAIMELSRAQKVLAIGEIGLDYHYDFSPREQQKKVFEAQLELACERRMPIVVHSRESNEEVLEVLAEYARKIAACVFHCFSGDEQLARRVLEMGFYIGVDGPVTYKSSEKLRRVGELCPMDRLLIETDCPYLTPIPHRGKRNEPAYVCYIAEEVARVKGVTVEEVARATSANAKRFFGERL